MKYRNYAFILITALCVITLACEQNDPPKNVTLLAHVNQYASTGYNDCWGYTAPDGREYALLGVKNGTSIVDITNIGTPVERAFISSSRSDWKDIKTFQNYAYAVNETGGGLQIIDLSDLPNSASLAATYNGISASHNIFIDEQNGLLYAEGGGSKPVIVFSLANPESPLEISNFGIECHDIFAQGNRAYISEGGRGSVGIWDMTAPAAPVFLQRIKFPLSGYVHNAWLTEDGQYLMSTEETKNKTVKLWDIRDLDSASISDDYLGPNSLAHNVHIKGNYAYISHYESGLRIVNITNPPDIFEAGLYDTENAWGTFPYFDSGKILISDIEDGLFVVRFEETAIVDRVSEKSHK